MLKASQRHLTGTSALMKRSGRKRLLTASAVWIAIFSEELQEPIVLARDDEAAKAAPAGFVIYTEAEVALLLTATPEELREVHKAKRFFSGFVVGCVPKSETSGI